MYTWVKLGDLVKWTHGKGPTAGKDTPVQGLCTDTRELKPGDIFVALKGDRVDGHQFIQTAIEKGAAAIIGEKRVTCPIPFVEVANSLTALACIGSELRNQFSGQVVAITGSAGKSSTKGMIATLLGPNAMPSPASFNNLLGLSKTLTLVCESVQYLVLEMGMNALFEIKELCEHFKPHVGVITNIGDAHIGRLGGREQIKAAKRELFEFIATYPQGKGVVVNCDDPLVVSAFKETFEKDSPVTSYSALGQNADVRILEKGIDPKNFHLTLKLACRDQAWTKNLPLFGLHHTQNIAAAVATALHLGLSPEVWSSRLDSIKPALHRGQISQLSGNRVLIDESYNSNPTALLSSLSTAAQVKSSRRRVLVLGDMLELEQFSQKLHQEAGLQIATLFANTPLVVLGVGKAVEHLVATVEKKLGKPCGWVVPDAASAVKKIADISQEGDAILIKGSRAIQLDKVVAALSAEIQ
ncbi:MAG: UDP-N-acetylmuramoyl-tripeptide--D-alanyl-D-alanine ligase [Deltaproteobacteria bacterium]|nr:UDP-N-acetylmuramoyl-tripeptide--D-alanyl-D-alanine ligase [Deltaproteobacteria bacterium]